MKRDLRYAIAGVASRVGQQISVDEFAERYPMPNPRMPGTLITGDDIRRIVGIEHKSWDPELFREFDTLVGVAEQAVRAADLSVDEIDAVVLVTGNPYWLMMDFDSFQLLRALGIPDHVAPIQLNAGCAGMARAMTLAAQTSAQNVLIVTYELASPYMESDVYRHNPGHPLADSLWFTPVLFSDGVAAVVLSRDPQAEGFVLYSRDTLSFGDQPGFDDTLVDYLGGGALHPPGTPRSEQLACWAVHGPKTREYYTAGILLNHEALLRERPGYAKEVRRIYLHQANPKLVDSTIDHLVTACDLDPELFVTNARDYGNLVSPSTVKLLHDDIASGFVKSGDRICVSVVGAGPERGAYTIALA